MSSSAVRDALFSEHIHENEICLNDENLNLPIIHWIYSRSGYKYNSKSWRELRLILKRAKLPNQQLQRNH